LRCTGRLLTVSNPDNGCLVSVEPATRRLRRPLIVRMRGELDLHSAAQAELVLMQALQDADGDLVVDLAGLRFCDCAGLNMFIRLRAVGASRGASVRLAAPMGTVRRVFEITQFGRAVVTYESVDAAVTNGDCGRIAHLDGSLRASGRR
jgi:anti-anti-sigma factor